MSGHDPEVKTLDHRFRVDMLHVALLICAHLSQGTIISPRYMQEAIWQSISNIRKI